MKEIQLEAYEVLDRQELKDLNSDGILLKHKKTGAKVCLILNDDENKVFTIGFRTPPADDTGMPHIIEHSVLCGSAKFPPKDPFVELLKGSLNTFLNAITYPDKTIYPIASCNAADFKNLMEVYLDAVFYPNVQKKKEFFLQEGWHYELEQADGELTVNGVVYNEMKGAYSAPEQVMSREIYRSLFPDTVYSKDSGGSPESIPTLTYEKLKAFHAAYYHPSNSYIYLYGDLDAKERLQWLDEEYLSRFERLEIDSAIKHQTPFERMVEREEVYPVASDEDDSEKTYFSYNTVIGTSLDKELYMAFEILEYALVSAPGAPVRAALMDAGIGKDVVSSFDNEICQPVFTIAVQNAKPGQKEEFLKIVRRVLTEQVEQGVNKKALLAGINSDEFKFLEADFGNFPKGLVWGIQSFDSWLYDEEKPFLHLNATKTYDFLRGKIGTGYFENLIKTYLLDNPHSSFVTLKPAKGLNQENEKKLASKLAEYKASLSAEECEKLVEDTRYLKEFQQTPSTKEELETIPMLTRADLKKTAPVFINKEEKVGDVTVLEHEMFSGHITYLRILFDMKKMPQEMIPYAALYKSVLSYVDTEKFTYHDLTNEINLQMGGMNIDIGIYSNYKNEEEYKVKFEIALKAFDEKVPDAVSLLSEMIAHSKLDDKKRLKEIIAQLNARLEHSLSANGQRVGAVRAMSYYSQASALSDAVHGIAFYRVISDLERNFEERYQIIVENLKKVSQFLFRPDNVMLSVTGGAEGIVEVKKTLPVLLSALSERKVPEVPMHFECTRKNEGFKDASQVQYVCQAGNYKQAGYEYKGTLRILRCILNCDYLWNQIRVLGGAYGCGSLFTRWGDVAFSTYRDPRLKKTLETFGSIPEYIRGFDADEREMTRYIIGTINESDVPLNPSAKGDRSMASYLTGFTYEDLQKERDEILSAQPEQIRELADMVEAALCQNNICVIGNEQAIEQEKETFERIETLL